MNKDYKSFSEFYPYYLTEHTNITCRRLHFAGSSIGLGLILTGIISGHWLLLLAALVVGYSFAWSGHYFFEKNRPATFRYPLYSFMGDWVMFKDILFGKVKI